MRFMTSRTYRRIFLLIEPQSRYGGQATWNLTGFSPKRDCGSKRVQKCHISQNIPRRRRSPYIWCIPPLPGEVSWKSLIVGWRLGLGHENVRWLAFLRCWSFVRIHSFLFIYFHPIHYIRPYLLHPPFSRVTIVNGTKRYWIEKSK